MFGYLSLRDFFKNCSQLFKLWDFLHKERAKAPVRVFSQTTQLILWVRLNQGCIGHLKWKLCKVITSMFSLQQCILYHWFHWQYSHFFKLKFLLLICKMIVYVSNFVRTWCPATFYWDFVGHGANLVDQPTIFAVVCPKTVSHPGWQGGAGSTFHASRRLF